MPSNRRLRAMLLMVLAVVVFVLYYTVSDLATSYPLLAGANGLTMLDTTGRFTACAIAGILQQDRREDG